MDKELKGLWRGQGLNTDEWYQGSHSSYQEIHYIEQVNLYRVKPETLTECVCQRDKLHRPIFEGDIVETKYRRLCKVVRKITPCFNGWDLIPIEEKHCPPDERDLWESKNLLVVGNIFDDKIISQQIWSKE